MKLRDANCCIYCGDSTNLSDEHVIPLSLGGKIVLPKASCDNCARLINSGFESKIASLTYGAVRSTDLLPTRRKNKRLKRIHYTITALDGSEKKITVDAAEAALAYTVPHFTIETMDVAGSGEVFSSCTLEVAFHSKYETRKNAILNRHSGTKLSYTIGAIEPPLFAKLLWKITHGALWHYARSSTLTAHLADRILHDEGQAPHKSSKLRVEDGKNLYYRNIISQRPTASPVVAGVNVFTSPKDNHERVFCQMNFHPALKLPIYTTILPNVEKNPIEEVRLE